MAAMTMGNEGGFGDMAAGAGAAIDVCRAVLGVFAEDLEPWAVTALIGVEPTRSHRKGERFSEERPVYAQGAWLLEVTMKAPDGPEEALSALLDLLPASNAVWRRVH